MKRKAEKKIRLYEQMFDKIFNKHFVSLSYFAASYTMNYEEAEEITQQVFLKLWEKKNEIIFKNTITSYLYASVKNASINYIKSKQVRKIKEANIVYENEESKLVFDKKKFKHFYQKAMESLPQKSRSVYFLSKHSGLTYSEIAEYLEISTKTVENQMGLALKKLRAELMPVKNQLYYEKD